MFGLVLTSVSTKMINFIRNKSNMRIFIWNYTENNFLAYALITSDNSRTLKLGNDTYQKEIHIHNDSLKG